MSLELFEPLVKPTAAQFNAIDAALDTLEAVVDGTPRQYMTQEYGGPDSAWQFRHKFRWLLYSSNGTLYDPNNVEDDTNLADAPGTFGVLDLDSVAWLAPGRFYAVSGCSYAVEVQTLPAG